MRLIGHRTQQSQNTNTVLFYLNIHVRNITRKLWEQERTNTNDDNIRQLLGKTILAEKHINIHHTSTITARAHLSPACKASCTLKMLFNNVHIHSKAKTHPPERQDFFWSLEAIFASCRSWHHHWIIQTAVETEPTYQSTVYCLKLTTDTAAPPFNLIYNKYMNKFS